MAHIIAQDSHETRLLGSPRWRGGHHPTGDATSGPVRLSFNPQLRVEFRGATVTPDAGLLLPRELDERLGVNTLIERHLADPRTGHNRHWTRPSCHRFRANEVRLLLGVIAYSLDNLLRRLDLPLGIRSCPLTSLQQRLLETDGRLIRHARYFVLQLADSYLTSPLFGQILRRIERLTWHPT